MATNQLKSLLPWILVGKRLRVLRRLNHLDTAKQFFEINIYLQLEWIDERLSFDDDLGHEDFIELDSDQVWTCPLIWLDPQGKPDPVDEAMYEIYVLTF